MVDNPKNCVYTSPVATLQGERQTKSRAVAQSGSALAWGARGRGFESRLPDEKKGGSIEPPFFAYSRNNGYQGQAGQAQTLGNLNFHI